MHIQYLSKKIFNCFSFVIYVNSTDKMQIAIVQLISSSLSEKLQQTLIRRNGRSEVEAATKNFATNFKKQKESKQAHSKPCNVSNRAVTSISLCQ